MGNEVGITYCLTFTPEEHEQLESNFIQADMELTKEGLKEVLLGGDWEDDEEELSPGERLGETLRQTLAENPEIGEAAVRGGLNLAKKFLNKKFKK